MTTPHDVAAGALQPTAVRLRRRRGLRQQWLTAVALLAALVVVTGASALVSAQYVVGKFTSAAEELGASGAYGARLERALTTNEEHSHALLGGSSSGIGRDALLNEQVAIKDLFRESRDRFPHADMQRVLGDAESRWQASLTEAGLWGQDARAVPTGDGGSRHSRLGSATADVLGALRELDAVAREQLRDDLAQARRSRQIALVLTWTVLGAALLAMLHFARRMSADVLRPVEALQEGVGRVRDGDLHHRIELPGGQRESELTDLAVGFNEMAVELASSHQELTYRAMHDSLTGLPNRSALRQRLDVEFAHAPGSRPAPDVSVLLIDLDDFKVVNDTLGHSGGDQLLMQVAERMQGCLRSADLVVRLGGDEFAVLVTEDSSRSAAAIAERLLGALSAPFDIAGTSATISASIGIATSQDLDSAEELLGHADFAMYMAKGQGKQRYQVYDAALHAVTAEHAVLRDDLHTAAAQGELSLDYQPIRDLTSGAVVGVEALLRWHHPVRGLIAPLDFIPLAEQTGEIDEIGYWVLRTAMDQLACWRQLPNAEGLWVSVNLSPVQLRNPQTVSRLAELLRGGPVAADAIILEITESALVLGVRGAVEALKALKATGARIALDDFGTGLSSLSTLSGLPIDVLKIDRAFVSGHGDGIPSRPVLQTVLALAEDLGLGVIAEGIEQVAHTELLKALGCRLGQGYGLGRPAGADVISALVASTTSSQGVRQTT